MVQAILRLYSYLVQLIVSLLCIGVASVAYLSENKSFEIDMLPWSGTELRTWLFTLGILGSASVLLAYKGKLRILFLLWTLFTTVLIARGIFTSGHVFDGEADFKLALYILAGVALTVAGAWSRFRQPVRR
ncbi:MAG: hypothetical protein HYX27_25580 [Acidobacteria bacterium]|nr:hypothetical protein [Acidobacteriota bacterium]